MSKPTVPQQYLDSVNQSIALAMKGGASQAEAALNFERGFTVNVRRGAVETLEYHRHKGVSITVYCDHRVGHAHTNDLSQTSIETAVRKALQIANTVEKDEYSGLADPAHLARTYPQIELYFPWSITPEQAIAIGQECEASAMAKDKRITNSEGVSVITSEHWHVYGNSNDFIGSYPSTSHSISCVLIAEDGHQMQRDYEYTSACDSTDLLGINKLATLTADKVLKRLGARNLSTCQVPIIFEANLARSFLGHFVSAISGNNLYRKASFLHDSLGQKIFPDFITLEQQPHLDKMMGSVPFDSEGVRTKTIKYVTNGVLESYVLGSYAARRLNMQTTGNANGVHNLFVNTQIKDLPDLLKKMDRGLLVTELIGQGINIVTGDYSRGAFGYWVEGGEIKYPVHEITIAGNLREMLANIVAIAGDVDNRGNIHTGSILLEKMMVAGQ